ncbi:hypothetical protein ACFX1X_014532 [Malus domestica]
MSHGNLKCENVVLKENLEAKVTKFALGNIVSEASCSSFSSTKSGCLAESNGYIYIEANGGLNQQRTSGSSKAGNRDWISRFMVFTSGVCWIAGSWSPELASKAAREPSS